MKRYLPYVLVAVLAIAVVLLFFYGKSVKGRIFDDRVTLKRQEKRPYATYVAYQQLNHLFPEATVRVTRNEPGLWDSISSYDNRQAFICITDRFGADEDELSKLMSFVRAGNDVFVSARYISSSMDDLLRCGSNASEYQGSIHDYAGDVRFSLSTPPFRDTVHYQYPGKSFYSFFTEVDRTRTQVLGTNENGHPNFIRLQAGSSFLYVHLEPLAFSNYFLLHGKNIGYYEKVMSLIRPDVKSIIWDEYYINKKPSYNQSNQRKGWMSVLMNMKNAEGAHPFRAAFWLLIVLGILYVLMEMRRRQRIIPVIRKPSNDSLDFVKTIGRLYYDRSDHRNLCRKMSAYFLEYVRSTYKLPTGMLNDEFVRLLHYKSGVPEKLISEIVFFIRQLDQGATVNEKQLAAFHKQLETFYQKA